MRLFIPLTLVMSVFLTGCWEDELTDFSTLSASDPTLNIIAPETVVITEMDTVILVEFELSEPQIVNTRIYVYTLEDESTAIEGEDFIINNAFGYVTIPAFTTSGSVEIVISADVEPEETEVFVVQLGDVSTANANFQPRTITVTLANFVDDVIDATFDWSGTYDSDTGTLEFCDYIDMDVLVWADPGFGTLLPYFDAATGDCPEHLAIDGPGWGDGTYYLAANLYGNYGIRSDDPLIEFPVTSTYARAGAYAGEDLEQDPSTIINSADPDFDNDAAFTDQILQKLVIEGGGTVFKFYNPVTDDLLLEGRQRPAQYPQSYLDHKMNQ